MSTSTETASNAKTSTSAETNAGTSTMRTADTEPGTATAADTEAVLDVLSELYTAWTAGDADAFAALYRDDATVVLPGVLHQSRNEIRDYMAAGFAGPLRGSRASDEPQNIRIVDGHTAIVLSRAGILFAGDDEVPAERERLATTVLSKQDGRWLIAAYANAPAH
jgi:uncharacterized protein (TIGR02246 family)